MSWLWLRGTFHGLLIGLSSQQRGRGVFAEGCQGDVFQPFFAISMTFYRKRSAAFFRLQHKSKGTICGYIRYEEGLFGPIMLRRWSFRLYFDTYQSYDSCKKSGWASVGICCSTVLCVAAYVGKLGGKWGYKYPICVHPDSQSIKSSSFPTASASDLTSCNRVDIRAEWSHLFLGLLFCHPHDSEIHFQLHANALKEDFPRTRLGF